MDRCLRLNFCEDRHGGLSLRLTGLGTGGCPHTPRDMDSPSRSRHKNNTWRDFRK